MSTPEQNTDDIILSLENVSRSFGNIIALNDITLRLKRGEVHCLLGDNGAGKSTLIKTLAGVYQPSKGIYRVDGKPVHFTSPRDALERARLPTISTPRTRSSGPSSTVKTMRSAFASSG